MKKKLIAACILLVLLAYACFKKELDRDPRTNLSYLAWKSGLINFNIDKHRFVFVRDSELIQKLYGTYLKEFTSRHEITLLRWPKLSNILLSRTTARSAI